MAKCKNCGKSMLLGRIKLADAEICKDCIRALGFDGMVDGVVGSLYKWEDVKDGVQAYWDRQSAKTAASMGLLLKHYRQLNAAGSTELEDKLFAAMCAIWKDERCDVSRLDISPGDGGSLLVLLDGVVVLEFKGEPDVKWILLPDSPDKIYIGSARITRLAKRIVDAYRSAE